MRKMTGIDVRETLNSCLRRKAKELHENNSLFSNYFNICVQKIFEKDR